MTFLALLAAPLAACGAAGASSHDGSDDVQCVTLFGITAHAAGPSATGEEMTARILHIARANGGHEWLNRIAPQSREIAARMEAAPDRDAVYRLFDGCIGRLDADPAFRAARPALLGEARRVMPRGR